MPEARIVCLARLMRCAIVASGTRNALAICAVVRPPTARSVSATADELVSAGWQHMKSSVSVSSSSRRLSTLAAATTWPKSSAAACSRCRRALSLRT